MSTIVKKIATKTILGGAAAIRKMPDGPIMRVFGVINGSVSGEGDNGPWTGFVGKFQAINLATGEIFVSSKCFLPGAAGDLIESTWKSAQSGDNPVESLEFAFDITKSEDDTSAVGYTYAARPLIDAKEADPLAALAGALPALPQLPAPEPDTTKKK